MTARVVRFVSVVLLSTFVYLVFPFPTQAAINKSFIYQGQLSSRSSGEVISSSDASCIIAGNNNDTCDFRARLYTAASGGTLVWEQIVNEAEFNSDGSFNLTLDCDGTFADCNQNDGPDFNTPDLYIQMEFAPSGDNNFSEVFTPRRQFSTVPFAFNSDTVDGVNINTITSNPEGSVTGSVGDLAVDTTNEIMYVKASGTDTNTGWVVVSSSSGITLADLTDTTVSSPTTGDILIYDGTDSWDNKALSGDATISSTGALTVVDVSCTDCLNATEISDIFLLNTGDTATGDYAFDTDTLVIDSTNNNVGIGTTTPGAKFHVKGTADDEQLIVQANATQTANTFELQNSSDVVLASFAGFDSTSAFQINKADTTNVFNVDTANSVTSLSKLSLTNATGSWDDITTANAHFTFQSTYSGGLDLSVMHFAAPANKDLAFRLWADGEGGSWSPYLEIEVDRTTGIQLYTEGYLDFKTSDTIGSGADTNDYIRFQTTSNVPEILTVGSSDLKINAGGSNNLLLNDGGGNVGIGTTTPTSKFHLEGAVIGKALAIFNETGDQDIFTASASGTPKFVIDNSGNVGIGIATPGTSLHVVADSSDNVVRIEENTGGEYMDWSMNSFGDLILKTDAGTVALFIGDGTGNTDGAIGIGGDPQSNDLFLKRNQDNKTRLTIENTNSTTDVDHTGIELTDSAVLQAFFSHNNFSDLTTFGSQVGELAIYSSGSERVRVDSTGNVGIGTGSPNGALEVLSTTATQLRLAYDTSNYHAAQTASDGGLTWSALGTDADLNFDFSGATDGDFSINANDLFVDTSTGNVGIGTATPTELLHLKTAGGNSLQYALKLQNPYGATSEGATGILFQVAGATDSTSEKGGIVFERTNTFGRGNIHFLLNNESNTNSATLNDAIMTIGKGGGVGIGTSPNSAWLHIKQDGSAIGFLRLEDTQTNGETFWINNGNSSAGGVGKAGFYFGGSQRMSFEASTGNVGIGTTSPSEHLEVSGTGDQHIQVTSTDGNSPGIKMIRSDADDWRIQVSSSGRLYFANSNNDGSNWYSYLYFGGTSSSAPVFRTNLADADLEIGAGNDLIFTTYGSSWDERMRILEAGYVGIGNTNPSYLLQMEASGGGYYNETTNAWVDGSSIRYKENIVPIMGALDIVDQLQGVYFNWNEEYGGAPGLGFVAEDVGQILPQIVDWNESDPQYATGLDYGKLTALNLEAIKELAGKVEEEADVSAVSSEEVVEVVKEVVKTELSPIVQWNYEVWTFIGEVVFKAKATFENTVEFLANVTFLGRSTFGGPVRFEEQITVGGDTAGQAIIPAGEGSVKVSFSKPYGKLPIVNLTPVGKVKVNYLLEEVSKESFVISIETVQDKDTVFNWLAVETSNETAPVEIPEPEIDVEQNYSQVQILPSELGYVRVREEPTIALEQIGQVLPGEIYLFDKISEEDNLPGGISWYHLEFEEEKWGWVSGTYIEEID